MKINLNIIKVFLTCFLLGNGVSVTHLWGVDLCIAGGCLGCKPILPNIKKTAKNINDEHKELERDISKKYRDEILDDNIKKIHKIQVGITKSVARINAMEHEANVDSKKLIFLLRKNKDLYTLPMGSQ